MNWPTARACVLTVAALGLFGSCTEVGTDGGEGADPPTEDSGSGAPGGTELAWEPCGLPRDGECATLAVPLDRDDPSGATIELALGRIPATGDSLGPLLVNPGGPGGSGIDFLMRDPVSAELARRFDVVSWDPRGVGDSRDLACGERTEELLALDQDPDDDTEQLALERVAAEVAQECGDLDGEVLEHLGTAEGARDMEAIRVALGAGQISYLGFSYGTHLGQEYARQFPGRVRAMVLDGVVDPALGFQEFLIGQAEGFEAAFDRNVSACAAAGEAECGVDDLAEAYDRVAAGVEDTPLRGAERPVGPAEVAIAAVLSNYLNDGWSALGPALAAAERGDGSQLWSLASSYYGLGDFTSYAAVVCIDSPPPDGVEAFRAFAAEAERRAPRFGAAVANELAVCATWPAAAVGQPAPIEAPGTPSILVVGNTGDPATPYRNATAVAETLEAGVLVTVELDGHTAYQSDPCATDLIEDYLIELVTPRDGTTCD